MLVLGQDSGGALGVTLVRFFYSPLAPFATCSIQPNAFFNTLSKFVEFRVSHGLDGSVIVPSKAFPINGPHSGFQCTRAPLCVNMTLAPQPVCVPTKGV